MATELCDHPVDCGPCQERIDALCAEVQGIGERTLLAFSQSAHSNAVDKGWWMAYMDNHGLLWPEPARESIPEKIALVHSELSEALEECRAGRVEDGIYYAGDSKPEGFGIEMADAVIRIMDLCCALGINLQECVELKMAYNQTRPYRHGGKVA